MAYSLGADYSKWQDDNSTPQQVDFAKAKRSGLSWVAIKTSQATWRDEDHAYNWRTAKAAGLLRAAYHFLVWDVQPTEQARFFFGLLKDDRPELDFVATSSGGLACRPTRSPKQMNFAARLSN